MPDKYALLPMENPDPRQPVYQIVALQSFSSIIAGDKGGFVSSTANLSQIGWSWIYPGARAVGDSRVLDNAVVKGNAVLKDNAVIRGNAVAMDSVILYEDCEVSGNATIRGFSAVNGSAQISGATVIQDRARVTGTSVINASVIIDGEFRVESNAEILQASHILKKGPALSSERMTLAYRLATGGIRINCGCFNGTYQEYADAIETTHRLNWKHPEYYQQYKQFADEIKAHFGIS